MTHYGPGPYGFASSEPDEMEALQSDVMRFMAILCLCLMVIFALVQSLPQNSKSTQVVLEKADAPPGEVSALLQEEIEVLNSERDLMYKALDSLQDKLSLLDSKVMQKESVNDQLLKAEQQLQQKIITKQQKLEMLEIKISARENSLQPVLEKKKRVRTVQQHRPKPVVSVTKEVRKEQSKPAPKQKPRPEPKMAAQKKAPEQKEGFTLRFQSPSALDYLVRKGDVQLLVQINKQFHSLQAKGTKLVFHSAPSPMSFHEMEAHTVPVRYKRLLAGSGIRVGQGQERIWGVVLPSSIRAEINKEMTGYKGGELQIDRRGRVSYHETSIP